MLDPSIAALRGIFETLRPAFTRPTLTLFVQVAMGWILTPGRHGVGAALVAGGISGRRHHSCFHRLFSLARWVPDEVERWLFEGGDWTIADVHGTVLPWARGCERRRSRTRCRRARSSDRRSSSGIGRDSHAPGGDG